MIVYKTVANGKILLENKRKFFFNQTLNKDADFDDNIPIDNRYL